MNGTKLRLSLVGALTVCLAFGSVPAIATATDTSATSDITVQGNTIQIGEVDLTPVEDGTNLPDADFDTVVTIELDNPTATNLQNVATELRRSMTLDPPVYTIPGGPTPLFTTLSSVPQTEAPGPNDGVKISCARGNYNYSDKNGTFNIRNNCGYGTVNWGFQMSRSLQNITTSSVTERGMDWWKNYKKQSRNAGHIVSKNYQYHGTFKPTANGNTIGYGNSLVFRVNVGGKAGTATLTVVGWNLKLVS